MDSKMSFVLTVSESKRLIAKAVVKMGIVKEALREGIIAIAKGTTNAYIIEELLNKRIKKITYTTGLTLPEGKSRESLNISPMPDVVLRRGEIVDNLSVIEAVREMKKGDIFIKGCNALDYTHKIAGILIGHPEGGTMGKTIGTIIGRGISLIIPVGLEKLVYTDINEMSRKLSSGNSPRLMPVSGLIITEVEALKILTGVKAYQLSAGGIGGAEGSVRLLIEGTASEIEKTGEIIEKIRGEVPFLV